MLDDPLGLTNVPSDENRSPAGVPAEAGATVIKERSSPRREVASRAEVDDCEQGIERLAGRLERLLADAESRCAALERRANFAQENCTESMNQMEELGVSCERAEALEGRLSGAAERLADRADEVQSRIADLLGRLSAAQEAGRRLEPLAMRGGQLATVLPRQVAAAEEVSARISAGGDRLQQTLARLEELRSDLDRREEEIGRAVDDRAARIEQEIERRVDAAIEGLAAAIARQTGEAEANAACMLSGVIQDLEQKLARCGEDGEERIQRSAEEAIAAGVRAVLRLRDEQVGPMRQECEQLVARVDSILRKADQAAREAETSVDEQQRRAEQQVRETRDRHEELVRAFAEAMERSFETHRHEFATWLEERNRQAAGVSAQAETALSSAESRLMELRKWAQQAIEECESRSGAALAEVSGQIEGALAEAKGRAMELHVAIDAAVAGGHEKIAEVISAHDNSVSQSAQRLAETAAMVEQRLGRADAHCYKLEQAAGELQGGFERIQADIDAAQKQVSFAREQVEQLAPRALHARDALARCVDASTEALGRLDVTRGQLESVQQDAESTLASLHSGHQRLASLAGQIIEGEQLFARLVAVSGQGEEIAGTCEERRKQASAVLEALHQAVAIAGDKASRLDSHIASASAASSGLSAATAEGRRVHEESKATAAELAALNSAAQASTATAGATIESLQRMEKDAAAILQQVEKKSSMVQQQVEVDSRRAQELVELLAGRIEAAEGCAREVEHRRVAVAELLVRLADLQPSIEQAESRETAMREATAQAADIHQRLGGAMEKASWHAGELVERADKARKLIAAQKQLETRVRTALTGLEQKLAAARNAGDASATLIREFLDRTADVANRLDDLDSEERTLRRQIAETLGRPEQITEEAQRQAEQLEAVCTSARKVVVGLSRAAIDARKNSQEAEAKGKTAADRLQQLSAQTDTAVAALREWVEEGLRVQVRLERTLRACPPLQATHSRDQIEQLARIGVALESRIANPSVLPGRTGREIGASAEPTAETGDPVISSRQEAVAGLIREARASRQAVSK